MDHNITSNKTLIANKFNNYFTSIADKLSDKIPSCNVHFSSFLKNKNPTCSIFLKPIAPIEVSKIINNLKSTKVNGPNSIPTIILKENNSTFSDILSKLFNKSITAGEFPTILKFVSVTPIYKNKGSPLEVNNYRPMYFITQ